jgi:hypothetical protein
MSLILGILAQSAGAAGSASSYESIATVTVGSGGTSTITFSSIPATFTHLQLRATAKSNRSSFGFEHFLTTVNSDTTYTNYRTHFVYGDGSAAIAGNEQPNPPTLGGFFGGTDGNAARANMFGVSVIDFIDYTNTNKNKTVKTFAGEDSNGAGFVILQSGLWVNTAAINSITISPQYGTLWSLYSSFALYGIKGV